MKQTDSKIKTQQFFPSGKKNQNCKTWLATIKNLNISEERHFHPVTSKQRSFAIILNQITEYDLNPVWRKSTFEVKASRLKWKWIWGFLPAWACLQSTEVSSAHLHPWRLEMEKMSVCWCPKPSETVHPAQQSLKKKNQTQAAGSLHLSWRSGDQTPHAVHQWAQSKTKILIKTPP